MIVTHASHLAAAGHEVTIKTALLDTVFTLDPRVRVERLHCGGKVRTLWNAAVLRHDAERVVADIIALIPLLLLRNRRRLVYFAQDYDESYYGSKAAKLFIRFLYWLSLSLCRVRCLAVSNSLADLLLRRFRARVVVAENGVDHRAFYYQPDPHLVSGKGERKAVLMLSRSDPRKGFDLAVRVGNLLREQDAGLELWTIGEPTPGRFPGFIHRDFGYLKEDSLRKVLSSADCLLYPSRHEGFGLMVLEAFACCCPVVTSTAIPYAVHENNALVVPIDDVDGFAVQVLRLVRDQTLSASLVAEGARLAGKQTLARAVSVFAAELLQEDLRHGW